MPTLHHLIGHYTRFGSSRQLLYTFSLLIFFWALFDGIISYVTPLLITQYGFSVRTMGFILSFSAVSGMVFDVLLARYVKRPHYRRMFLLVLLISSVYPLLLMRATTIPLLLVTMSIWGLYYDLVHFGIFDFISRVTPRTEHAQSFGVVDVFRALGYLLAPLLTTMLIGYEIGEKPFVLMFVFLVPAVAIFLVLIGKVTRGTKEFMHVTGESHRRRTFREELRWWRTIVKPLAPVLILTLFLYGIDAAFWTIGPLLAGELQAIHPFGGLLVVAYMAPPLFVGWVVGAATSRFGKKRTAFVALAAGSLVLLSLAIVRHPVFLIGVVFISSFFLSFAWPALNGAFSDYITETPLAEKEIEGIQDVFVNAGYSIGPSVAGILAYATAPVYAFALFGCVGVILAIILFVVTPTHIHLAIPPREA
ncbi:MFS transporter [Candidatus Roizmanbacteria bacterium]|nr:MFS transporter [Candidatus Roizmanbacteria bacterium]